MLEQVKCDCGCDRFFLYTQQKTGEMHTACSSCGAIKADITGAAAQQSAPSNDRSSETLGSPRDESQDLVSSKKIGKVLRLPEVMKATGLAKSTIYKMMAENPPRFPPGTKLRYTKVHVWCEEVIEAYQRGQWQNGWKPSDMNRRAKTDKKEIIRLFIDERKRQCDIARLTGWPQSTVRQMLTFACQQAYENAKSQDNIISAPFNPYPVRGKKTPDLSNQISCDIWRCVIKEHLGEPNEGAFKDWCKRQKQFWD